MDAGTEMNSDYYWFKLKDNQQWGICLVSNGYVHFFGEVSQELGNEYVSKYVEFGPSLPNEPYPPMVLSYHCAQLDMEGLPPVPDDELTRLRQEFEKAFYGPWRGQLYITPPGCQISTEGEDK